MTLNIPGQRLSLAVLAAASFYRPLVFWAENAWDLSSPLKPLAVGLLTLGVACLGWWGLSVLTRRPLVCAIGVALLILALMNWRRFSSPYLVLGAVAIVSVALSFVRESFRRGLAWILVAAFGIAPLVQLGLSHLSNDEPYPIVDLAPRRPTIATGAVEDLLFVVVDGYPSLSLAEDWFGHDARPVTNSLENLSFVVPQTAWTQLTFTALSVPSMLELQPIAEPGPTSYGNRSSVFSIMRGESLVSAALRSAGFEYTHIESGWDGDTCHVADRCIGGPLVDETIWRLFETSAFYGPMESLGSYMFAGTRNTVDALHGLRQEFGDGESDYVFAHLMLPHEPNIVDSQCRPVSPGIEPEHIQAQMACVDMLIAEIAALTDETTAVVIVGDHGSHTLEQRFIPADAWTDAQIAERFGTFVAYRFPAQCAPPIEPVNLEVMRAAVSCTVEIDLPPNHGRFLIGADNPKWVARDRMAQIQDDVSAGLLSP